MKIPIKRGMLIGEPRVPRRSRSHYLSNAPGLADQLVASRKDSAREGGSCAAYFCKVPDSRESELGLVRYGPASRVHRGVFGPFEGSFPIRIPADPDKFLAIREFHVVHGCVLFPMCPGSQINLLRVRKTLCASVATSVGKFRKLSAQPYFVGLFSRAWPCTEASLGSQDMILRTEAVGMFLMPRVLATTLSFLVRFRPVKYGIEALDILYTLVKGWTPIDDQFSPIRPTAYLGGNVCAKILSDPLQLGPRAKTLRQEVHFSYHTQLSDRQELLRSSRNLSQKMTPWHKEHSDGLCSQDHILRTQARLCARLSLPDSQQVDLRARAHWKEDTSMHDVELSDRQEFIGVSRNPDRKTALKRTKNTPVDSARGAISHESKLGFPRIRNLAKIGSASFPTVPRTSK
uniref:Uncharacterized protein n=1 Tax=Fagus sylvatica TaxID=28930 RepID=A0A2N9HWF4_FAGSY